MSSLGAGALAGSSLPLNPERTAKELGFDSSFANSIDAVSDRDYVAEALFIFATIGLHLSRIGEEWTLWASTEFAWAKVADEYSTGSSIMPQKKNPDMAELARGKSGRLIGNLVSVMTMLKGLPFAYNRDLQEELPGEEAPAGEEDMVSMDGDSEEIDINELLAELEGMEKEEPINEMGPEYIEGAAQLVEMFPFLTMQTASLVIGALGAAGLAGFSAIAAKVQDMALAGKFGGSAKSFAEKLQAAGGAAAKATQNREGVETVNEEVENIDENIDVIYELINMFPFLTNSTAQMLLGVFGAVGITGLSAIAAKIHQMAEDGVFGEAGKKLGSKLTSLGKDAASARNVSEESEDLNEALKTINVLKNQLQEVNLLNAKLLYVNKVFKSNNLSEGQKVNVIAAFDKAETVKEVKLVFETVSKNVVAKPATIKEHRSFASKATGNAQTTAPKEIISEVSEQVSRWQKLAGIIK